MATKKTTGKSAGPKKTKSAPKKVAGGKTQKTPPAKKIKTAAKAGAQAKGKENSKVHAHATKSPKPTAAESKKVEVKKSTATVAKAPTKKDMQDKVAVGKKPGGTGGQARPGAVAGTSLPKKPEAQILSKKVEPKIIETQPQEFAPRVQHEDLFNPEELEYFRTLLFAERGKILTKARKAMDEGNIHMDRDDMFDEVDQASAMIDQNLTFRLLDRDRKLLTEIEHALAKLDTGDFGYCEGTGEPIPKRRLELRPWCRHSVKYKERLERMKKSGRGVVDEDEI